MGCAALVAQCMFGIKTLSSACFSLILTSYTERLSDLQRDALLGSVKYINKSIITLPVFKTFLTRWCLCHPQQIVHAEGHRTSLTLMSESLNRDNITRNQGNQFSQWQWEPWEPHWFTHHLQWMRSPPTLWGTSIDLHAFFQIQFLIKKNTLSLC